MGYSHYWDTNCDIIDESAYAAAIADIRKIVAHDDMEMLIMMRHVPGFVAFDGAAGTCETFSVAEDHWDALRNDSCKTRGYPYDIYVVACLSRLSEVPGIKVRSDGYSSAWADGSALASKILGRHVQNPILMYEDEEDEDC